jgi:hypothetical protein
VQGAFPSVAAPKEKLILETADASLVRKLHAMRAARSVFEHEQGRWVITRIAPVDGTPDGDDQMWAVFGRRARR